MDRRKIIEILGGILVAAIFIFSGVSLANYGGSSTANATTTINAQTVFAVGYANATITGYYPAMTVDITCKNATLVNSSISILSNALTTLEGNNSVSDFYSSNNKISVSSGNSNSIQVYHYLYGMLSTDALNCTRFSGGVSIELPHNITMKVQTQSLKVYIPTSMRAHSLNTNLTMNLSGKIPVKVSALLYLNGTISGLNITKS
ncbi:MAG: hypothetical protein KGH72_05630 [Candidatus Micrarchaeota archaeon]|nr:hypothetical protein [Candidatus Micrarchaeota archaeon]